MTDRYIRAMLRRATQVRILTGWQGPHVPDRSYTVAPTNGPAGEWPLDRVRIYVAGLETAGLEPLYRESEPLHL
jgi:hypothetical protein